MSGLYRDNRATHNFFVIWKIREDSRNKPEANGPEGWVGAPRVGEGTLPKWPIRLHLMDPASLPLRMNNNR
jgi:hypothetical protein